MDTNDTQVLTREFPAHDGATPPWEQQARQRLASAVERFSGPLRELLERDANEGDTRFLVTDFLSDGLGYDKYAALTTEYRTTGESVDYGITIGEELFAFIEVKQCGQDLGARNLRQARSRAVEEGVEWVLLTNGRVWQMHHVAGGGASDTRLVLEVDLLAEDGPATVVDHLFHLTREAVEHGRLTELRMWREELDAQPLARTLQTYAVVEAVRGELRRRTGHTGHTGADEEILRALREKVFGRGLIESP